MTAWLTERFAALQQWAFETLVQPAMFALGMGNLLEDAYEGTGWVLVGMLQIALMLAVLAPLEHWRPVEPIRDRAAVRTDVLYTLLHRLGFFRIALFLLVDPLFDSGFGFLRTQGWHTFQLDDLWPGLTDRALVSFAIYLVLFDFLEYWIHRGQHQLQWWWNLHALHHSQRQMTMWSDNRNHLLDDVLHASIVVVAAQVIGIPPGQFIAVVAIMQLSQNLQHANLRLWFGRVGERLWVSPRFHRVHHSIGIGHEFALQPPPPQPVVHAAPEHPVPQVGTRLGGCNFGVLLPWWDVLFRTGDFTLRYEPTGIRDQVEPDAHGRLRDYGRGFWAQQWLGFKRLAGRD